MKNFADFVSHEYVNMCSNGYYLQQHNIKCVEPSMGLTPCWINHALVYSIDSTSLRFNGQVTEAVVPVLLLTNREAIKVANLYSNIIVRFSGFQDSKVSTFVFVKLKKIVLQNNIL